MKNILYDFDDSIAWAELQDGVELQVISHAPDQKMTPGIYELSEDELGKIKKAKTKNTVVKNIIKDKKSKAAPTSSS